MAAVYVTVVTAVDECRANEATKNAYLKEGEI